MSMKSRVCGSCGNTQGPFDREFVGFRKTGQWVFTCPMPVRDATGKRVSDAKRREAALACLNRRDKKNATAQTHNPTRG